MKPKRATLVLAAALFLPHPALAAEPPPKTPALLEKGKAVFAKYCASCHGQRGEGDGPAAKALKPRPRNLATEPLQKPQAAGVFETVSTGVKGTAMVAWKHLPEEDRWAVSYYVLSLKDEAAKK
jgi:mono/diheme cytochrome c family protein